MGLISAIGDSVEENRISLQQERSGIAQIRYYETAYAGKLPAAEVRHDTADTQPEIYSGIQIPPSRRTSLLALHAVGEAIQDSGLTVHNFLRRKRPWWVQQLWVVCASPMNCITTPWRKKMVHRIYLPTIMHRLPWPSRNDTECGVKSATINTACSSSANAIIYGARLIRHGFCKRAIVGGAESLAKFTINGFNALNILSSKPCAPFDRDRPD